MCDLCNDSIAAEMESEGFGGLVHFNKQCLDELKENLFTMTYSQDVILQTVGKARFRGSSTRH